ncbi:endolytic transglycosylase MltG [Candidatus Falkowbacteria bacterium]|nr:endolytic transglycosylase MltG [Candidatus Falkowbacteria bacterium]
MFKLKPIVILIAVAAVILAVYFLGAIFSPASREGKTIYFKIEPGEGVNKISANLQNYGLIKNGLIFKAYVFLIGSKSKLLAGEHKLNTNMNIINIIKSLATNEDKAKEKKITIIEGWGAKEIADYLEKQQLVKSEEFLNAMKIDKWRSGYDFLSGVKAKAVEGFLFPDTYRVFIKASADDIIKKMLDNFDKKLTAQMREDIIAQKRNIFEVITLASIIEREGMSENDKKMIADVFWKRVDAGMGLESDATINYITGKNKTRPSIDDIKTDSPYNTYKYRGLPPGPISNPGLVSIKAAIYPKKNDYLFFLTDKDGQAIFAKTYEKHQENIKKYLE